MSDEKLSLPDVARQVVVNFGAGLAAGYAGPMAGAAAQGAVPAVLAGMDWISATIGNRRIEHSTETMMDAAEAAGASTPEEFIAFVNAALSDEEHQELLARALTIAQDTAMRDKRRALGRSLAAAASDIGTKVDDELLFMRVLADLDAAHIRCLRLMQDADPLPTEKGSKRWDGDEIGRLDAGLAPVIQQLLRDLERLGLVAGLATGRFPLYNLTIEGVQLLARLAQPDKTESSTPPAL